MLDHEGHLALFIERWPSLLPGERMFCDENGEPLSLIRGPAGKSGRRKLEVVDWDGDGRLTSFSMGRTRIGIGIWANAMAK